MYTAKASIEIATSPEVVREKFLRFEDLPKYHQDGFFRKIEPMNPKNPLEVGEKLRNHFQIGVFEAEIRENTADCFKWAGGNAALFVGTHSFFFEPSMKTPGGTTFTQYEEFTGAFSFLMGRNVAAKVVGLESKSLAGWNKFNEDFKRWCERS